VRVSECSAAQALAPEQQRLEQRRMTHGLVLERTVDELVECGFAAPVPQFEDVERGVDEWGDLGDCHGLRLPSLATAASVAEGGCEGGCDFAVAIPASRPQPALAPRASCGH
jgi:hypothetical protein